MKVFDNGGTLAFWWPRVSYWNSFEVRVRDAGGNARNRVTNITNSTEPSSSKKVTVTMRAVPIGGSTTNAQNMYAPRYYDSDNTAYYGDFASTSIMNNVRVDGQLDIRGYIDADSNDPIEIYANMEFQDNQTLRFGNGSDLRIWHDGSNHYFRNYNHGEGDFYFQGEDNEGTNHALLYLITDTSRPYVQLFEDGAERLRTVSDGVRIYGAARLNDSGNNGRFVGHSGWGTYHYTDSGYILFGPANSGHAHIYTDRSNFYFNKQIQVNGGSIINTSDIRANIFYDKNDTGYYVDPNTTSTSINVRGEIRNPSVWINDGDNYNNYNENIRLFNAPNGVSVIAFSASGTGGTPTTSILGYSDRFETRFGSSWQTRVRNGYAEAAGSYRAPIFYDNNNTGFYANPASQSNFNTLTLTGNRIGFINTSFDAEIRVSDANPNGTGAEFVFYGDTGANNAQLTAEVGNFTAQVRTPIMYDSNNTGYYSDPASTSRLNSINANELIIDGYEVFDTNSRSVSAGNWYTIAECSSGRAYATFQVWDNNGSRHGVMKFTAGISYGGKGTITMLGKSWYSSGGIFNNIRIRRTGTYDRMYLQIYVDTNGTLYSAIIDSFSGGNKWTLTNGPTGNPGSTTAAELDSVDSYPGLYTSDNMRSKGSIYADGSMYADRFYDWNNASFYVDPASTSYLNDVRADIYYDRNNTSYYGNFASTSYFNDIRPNIMYDRNDTGFYVNPRNNSRMSGLRLSGIDNQASGDDALLWLDKPNNNDWGIILTGDDDYGIDLRMASSNNYAFRILRGGSEMFRVNSDYAYHYSDMRSPIFYDSSNTGYYVDPASFSNLNSGLRATEIYARNWFRNDNSGEGLYNQSTGMHWYSDSSSRWRAYSGSSTSQILFTTSGNNARGYVYATNSNEIGFLDQGGSWAIRHQNDNGTYFYTDGSSLEFSVGRDTVGGNYGTVRTHSTRGGWGGYSINGGWVFMHDHSNAAGIYNDYENEWAILMYRNSYVELRYNGTWEQRTQSGYVQARGSYRAPLFYDSNDTGYYVDPNSTGQAARFRGRIYIGPNNSWGRYLQVGGNGREFVNNSSIASVVTTNGNLHLDSASGYTTYINYYDGGTTIFGTGSNNEVARLNSDYFRHNSDVRTPIFYDNNNTGYYGDFASTTITNVTRANYLSNRYDVSTNHQFGMYFSSGRSTAYAIYREGGGWSYRYPDLRIAFHTGIKFGANASYNGMRFYNDYNMATQVMSVNNSTDPLGTNNVYVNYNLQAGSSLRAPIFYDSNNTGYYFNGASAHSTRFEGVSNRTMAYMGLPGHTRNSGEYYRSRPRQTSDTNYWTGAYGWGRQDMNVVSTWGSGFIDSWSNPPNQPSGTSHWVGMQAFHYRSSNTGGYGWQMVGGPITNLRFRSSWSGWRSWRTIPVLDENSGNGGSMYAGRYYDSNNTGYYVDPASTSNQSSIYVNNWFRARSSSGLYFQDRGCGLRAVRDEGGQYGTVATYGSDVGGYEGWSIGGRIVFMHDMSSANGIYNDVNNEWHMLNYRNDRVRLYYNGAEKIRTESYGAYVIGSMRSSSDIIAYYSDMRLKDKEGDIENALDKIGKLNGFYYRNNKEANAIGYEGTELQVGVSAQDVKEVLPEIVKPAPLAEQLGYDYMTIQYDKLTPLLINAVNEQNDIVKSQKEEIEYLKSELSEMKEMMKQLLKK